MSRMPLLLLPLPAKHCSLDPVLTWLIKKVDNVIAPVIVRIMCNASFEQGILPDNQKRTVMRPILKKPSLDPIDLNSYRSISNLSFVSKMVERAVDSRLIAYLFGPLIINWHTVATTPRKLCWCDCTMI